MASSNTSMLDTATQHDASAWMHFGADPRFDYPIDYSIKILGACAAAGTVDFLGKWAPNSYCHFHKHLGNTTSLVLEGEHHTVETIGGESIHKVRQAGDYAQKPGGDVHMEFAGPQGSVVFFSMQAVDGKLFEVLGRAERVLNVTTYEDFLAGNMPR